jgi:hypothetical protein
MIGPIHVSRHGPGWHELGAFDYCPKAVQAPGFAERALQHDGLRVAGTPLAREGMARISGHRSEKDAPLATILSSGCISLILPDDDEVADADAAPVDEPSAFEDVRDSWFDSPFEGASNDTQELDERPRSEPPALPPSLRELPCERTPFDAALADRMFDRLAAGDYSGALLVADALLRRSPRDADALDCAEISRSELRRLYETRLRGLDRVASIALLPAETAALPLDAFAGYLLSRVDGFATLEEIAFARGVDSERALRTLSELYLSGVLALERESFTAS